MRPPTWSLTSSARRLTLMPAPPDRLGQTPKNAGTWTPSGDPLPCAVFPASEKSVRRAGLLGVTVEKEVYLAAIDLTPGERLEIGGRVFEVRDVAEWPGVTVALVGSVP